MLTPEQIDVTLEQQKSKHGITLNPQEDSFAQVIARSGEFKEFALEAVNTAIVDPGVLFGFLATAMYVGYQLGKADVGGSQQSQLVN